MQEVILRGEFYANFVVLGNVPEILVSCFFIHCFTRYRLRIWQVYSAGVESLHQASIAAPSMRLEPNKAKCGRKTNFLGKNSSGIMFFDLIHGYCIMQIMV